jgi:hypothetical protein
MIISLILAAQLVATDPAKAGTYFSSAALNAPVESCGRRAKRPAISAFEASWYSAVWIRAGEPSLAAGANASSLPTWRFTNIPTWTAPMIFRISKESNGRLRMIAKRLSGQGGYDPGSLKDRIDRFLTSDEQRWFQDALMSVDDVLAKPVDDCIVILDGDELLLERTQAGRYVIGQRFWQAEQPMAGMNALLSGFAGWSR